MKNYRVSATKSGFIIELDIPVGPSLSNIDAENLIYGEHKPDVTSRVTNNLCVANRSC